MTRREQQRLLAIGQGVYFAATGVWPLLDIESFERVTGPKVDKWMRLAAIDTFYATNGRIARIYLADAAVEAAIVSAWAATA